MRYKQKELYQYIKVKNIKLVRLIETRVKENNSCRISKDTAHGWDIMTNYQHAQNGRIWLLWNPRWYNINVLQTGAQFLHCHIRDNTGRLN